MFEAFVIGTALVYLVGLGILAEWLSAQEQRTPDEQAAIDAIRRSGGLRPHLA